jgi:hypothetical protein
LYLPLPTSKRNGSFTGNRQAAVCRFIHLSVPYHFLHTAGRQAAARSFSDQPPPMARTTSTLSPPAMLICQHERGIISRFTATAIALSVSSAHQSALHRRSRIPAARAI